jgi:hypothetical protein
MKSRTPKRAAAETSPTTKSAPVRRPRTRKAPVTPPMPIEATESLPERVETVSASEIAAGPDTGAGTSDVSSAVSEAAAPGTTSAVPSERIAQRAYELFVDDGAVHGRDLDHWLAAERELTEDR